MEFDRIIVSQIGVIYLHNEYFFAFTSNLSPFYTYAPTL